jgi:uncharacterized membrane protein YkvA (DUF1232 family)
MTPSDSRFLRTFQSWLDAMPSEVHAMSQLLELDDTPGAVRQASAEGLAYLLRSVELIPEGLEDLGYLDDLFAFRVLAERAVQAEPSSLQSSDGDITPQSPAWLDPSGTLARLAADAEIVAEFLGDDYRRLTAATFASKGQRPAGARAEELISDADVRAAALAEARAWAESYRAPKLASGAEELVKIRSFFRTKLSRAS